VVGVAVVEVSGIGVAVVAVEVASDDGRGCWRSSIITLREIGILAMVSVPSSPRAAVSVAAA
jgi:hypothetical protein